MAQILAFKDSRARKRSARAQGACEIIIFPGVRVVYHEAEAKGPGASERVALPAIRQPG